MTRPPLRTLGYLTMRDRPAARRQRARRRLVENLQGIALIAFALLLLWVTQ